MQIVVKFLETEQSFAVGFSENPQALAVGFDHFQSVTGEPEFDYYTGEYEVTPRTTRQVLDTGQKIMTDDLVVVEIPFAAVTNNANGLTVTIGEPDKPPLIATDDGRGNVTVTGLTADYDGISALTVTGANIKEDNENVVLGGK